MGRRRSRVDRDHVYSRTGAGNTVGSVSTTGHCVGAACTLFHTRADFQAPSRSRPTARASSWRAAAQGSIGDDLAHRSAAASVPRRKGTGAASIRPSWASRVCGATPEVRTSSGPFATDSAERRSSSRRERRARSSERSPAEATGVVFGFEPPPQRGQSSRSRRGCSRFAANRGRARRGVVHAAVGTVGAAGDRARRRRILLDGGGRVVRKMLPRRRVRRISTCPISSRMQADTARIVAAVRRSTGERRTRDDSVGCRRVARAGGAHCQAIAGPTRNDGGARAGSDRRSTSRRWDDGAAAVWTAREIGSPR